MSALVALDVAATSDDVAFWRLHVLALVIESGAQDLATRQLDAEHTARCVLLRWRYSSEASVLKLMRSHARRVARETALSQRVRAASEVRQRRELAHALRALRRSSADRRALDCTGRRVQQLVGLRRLRRFATGRRVRPFPAAAALAKLAARGALTRRVLMLRRWHAAAAAAALTAAAAWHCQARAARRSTGRAVRALAVAVTRKRQDVGTRALLASAARRASRVGLSRLARAAERSSRCAALDRLVAGRRLVHGLRSWSREAARRRRLAEASRTGRGRAVAAACRRWRRRVGDARELRRRGAALKAARGRRSALVGLAALSERAMLRHQAAERSDVAVAHAVGRGRRHAAAAARRWRAVACARARRGRLGSTTHVADLCRTWGRWRARGALLRAFASAYLALVVRVATEPGRTAFRAWRVAASRRASARARMLLADREAALAQRYRQRAALAAWAAASREVARELSQRAPRLRRATTARMHRERRRALKSWSERGTRCAKMRAAALLFEECVARRKQVSALDVWVERAGAHAVVAVLASRALAALTVRAQRAAMRWWRLRATKRRAVTRVGNRRRLRAALTAWLECARAHWARHYLLRGVAAPDARSSRRGFKVWADATRAVVSVRARALRDVHLAFCGWTAMARASRGVIRWRRSALALAGRRRGRAALSEWREWARRGLLLEERVARFWSSNVARGCARPRVAAGALHQWRDSACLQQNRARVLEIAVAFDMARARARLPSLLRRWSARVRRGLRHAAAEAASRVRLWRAATRRALLRWRRSTTLELASLHSGRARLHLRYYQPLRAAVQRWSTVVEAQSVGRTFFARAAAGRRAATLGSALGAWRVTSGRRATHHVRCIAAERRGAAVRLVRAIETWSVRVETRRLLALRRQERQAALLGSHFCRWARSAAAEVGEARAAGLVAAAASSPRVALTSTLLRWRRRACQRAAVAEAHGRAAAAGDAASRTSCLRTWQAAAERRRQLELGAMMALQARERAEQRRAIRTWSVLAALQGRGLDVVASAEKAALASAWTRLWRNERLRLLDAALFGAAQTRGRDRAIKAAVATWWERGGRPGKLRRLAVRWAAAASRRGIAASVARWADELGSCRRRARATLAVCHRRAAAAFASFSGACGARAAATRVHSVAAAARVAAGVAAALGRWRRATATVLAARAELTAAMRLQGWRRFVGGTATVVAARQEAEEFVAFVTRQLGRAMVAYLHAWRRHAQSCATSHTQLRFASAVGVERRCAAAIQGLRSTSMARHRARRLLRCGQTAAVRDCLAALRGAAARGALAMQQAASAASHLRKRRLFRAMAQLHRLPAAFSLDRCAAAWWAHRAAGAALRSWAMARAATVMLERVRQVRLALSWARVRGRLTLASRANLHKKRFSLPPPKPAAAAPLLQRLTTTDAAGFRAFADRAAARRALRSWRRRVLRAFWAAAAAARAERAVVARAWLRLLATLNAGGHADLLRVAAKRFAKAAVALRALRRWSLACVRGGAAALRAVEPLAVRLALARALAVWRGRLLAAALLAAREAEGLVWRERLTALAFLRALWAVSARRARATFATPAADLRVTYDLARALRRWRAAGSHAAHARPLPLAGTATLQRRAMEAGTGRTRTRTASFGCLVLAKAWRLWVDWRRQTLAFGATYLGFVSQLWCARVLALIGRWRVRASAGAAKEAALRASGRAVRRSVLRASWHALCAAVAEARRRPPPREVAAATTAAAVAIRARTVRARLDGSFGRWRAAATTRQRSGEQSRLGSAVFASTARRRRRRAMRDALGRWRRANAALPPVLHQLLRARARMARAEARQHAVRTGPAARGAEDVRVAEELR